MICLPAFLPMFWVEFPPNFRSHTFCPDFFSWILSPMFMANMCALHFQHNFSSVLCDLTLHGAFALAFVPVFVGQIFYLKFYSNIFLPDFSSRIFTNILLIRIFCQTFLRTFCFKHLHLQFCLTSLLCFYFGLFHPASYGHFPYSLCAGWSL